MYGVASMSLACMVERPFQMLSITSILVSCGASNGICLSSLAMWSETGTLICIWTFIQAWVQEENKMIHLISQCREGFLYFSIPGSSEVFLRHTLPHMINTNIYCWASQAQRETPPIFSWCLWHTRGSVVFGQLPESFHGCEMNKRGVTTYFSEMRWGFKSSCYKDSTIIQVFIDCLFYVIIGTEETSYIIREECAN